MFDLFKKNTQNDPKDAKTVRDRLLQCIKEQLKKAEGGEGANIKSIQVFIAAAPDERHMYESAVYFDEGDRFKNEEVQRIADDYAIELPEQWTMEINFVDTLPADAIKISGLDAALFIATRKNVVKKTATAYIKVRIGEAEKPVYAITSNSGKICIGRERSVQTGDGFYRENQIAFPQNSDNASNRFISRQHAHIEFDNESGNFVLFADEGGIPPRNKVKVRQVDDANPVKLFTTNFGHALQEGDQILLGESALLEFSYSEGEREL
jgi:hypothetical protein